MYLKKSNETVYLLYINTEIQIFEIFYTILIHKIHVFGFILHAIKKEMKPIRLKDI